MNTESSEHVRDRKIECAAYRRGTLLIRGEEGYSSNSKEN